MRTIDPAWASARAPSSAPVSTLMAAQLDLLIAQQERQMMEAAQQAAPLSAQLQLALDLVALRQYRLVGQGGMIEITDLTLAAQQAGVTIGLLGQVLVDGLRGKVDDGVIERIARIRDTGIEAIELTHVASAAALHERVQNFKARSSDVRLRDVAYALACNKMPGKPGGGRR